MAVLRTPYWWGAVGVFLLHQLAQYLGYRWGPADAYLDPLLFLPILLGLWLAERRWLLGTERLPGAEVLGAGIVLAVVGEEVFPRLEDGFVRDEWDYAAYGLGLVYFHFRINPPA